MLNGGFGLWMILVWLGGLFLVVLIDAINESCQDGTNWKNLHKALEGRPSEERKPAPALDLFGTPVHEDPYATPPPVTVSMAATGWARGRPHKRRPESHPSTRTSQARA